MFPDPTGQCSDNMAVPQVIPRRLLELMHIQNILLNTEKLQNWGKLNPSRCRNQRLAINASEILEAQSLLGEGLS